MSLFDIFSWSHFFANDPIKNEIYQLIEKHVDLEKKNIKNPKDIKKTDLDSVELITLFKEIEKKWGKMDLATFYKAQSIDEIVYIIKNK